jgi:hypothetical protein
MGIEQILQSIGKQQQGPSAELVIRRLATNKPLRVFLTDVARMPNVQFAEFVGDFKRLFSLAQNDIVATSDSGIMLEVMKYPQFAGLLAKIAALG